LAGLLVIQFHSHHIQQLDDPLTEAIHSSNRFQISQSIDMNSIFLISAILAGTCLIFSDADQEKKDATAPPRVNTCYECTSARDPGCADEYEGSSKFPHEGKLKFNYSRNCADPDLLPYYRPGEPVPVAVGCRKILQEVDSNTRVVRQCAYQAPDGAYEVSGLKRTGNQGVRLFYYQCARDYCNGATRHNAAYMIFAFCASVISALVMRW